MTEKQEKFLELLGVKLGQKFKVEGLETPFYFCETEGKKMTLYMGESIVDQFTFFGLLTGNIIPIEEPILTDKEKKYLENVCKPFKNKNRIDYIEKRIIFNEPNNKRECIIINLINKDFRNGENFPLPLFEQGTMYKGMKNNQKYTLKELGLFEQNENANDDN